MKSRIGPDTVLRGLALVAGCMWLTAFDCGDATSPRAPQDCTTSYDSNFPIGGHLSLALAAHCPINVLGAKYVSYSAVADFPAGSVQMNNYEGTVVNRLGGIQNAGTSGIWSMGDGKYFVTISGGYTAATGGFDSYDNGYDDVVNGFSLGGGQSTHATTRIPYTIGPAYNRVSGPGNADPNSMYTVTVNTSDPQQVRPLTWSWYVDGTYVGSTGDSPELTVQAGGPNTFRAIRAIAVDPSGRTTDGSTTVYTGSGCVDEDGNPLDECP